MEETINKLIAEKRIEQQLSINALAKLANVSASYLSKIENNTRSPSIYVLKKLAPYLNVDYLTLLSIANTRHKKDNSESSFEFSKLFKYENITYMGQKISKEKMDYITKMLEQEG